MEKSKKYHRIKNWLFLTNILISLGILVFILFSGLSADLRDKILMLSKNNFLVVAIYIFILNAAYFLISFPLSFYEGHILEHRFGLSKQRFSAWLKDIFKKQAIELVILLVVIEVLYVFLKSFPIDWWIYAGVFWIFLTIILAKITPIVLIPLFFKATPLKNESLKNKILSLVVDSGSTIKDIFVIDFSRKTKKSNALVCGLGKNRRILLADNLVSEFNDNEVSLVVAHELAHEVHKDTIRLLLAGSAFSFLAFFICDIFLKSTFNSFGFSHIHDIAAFPLVAFSFFMVSLFILPVQNAYIRRRERKADLYALNLTYDPQSFISMMEKLAEKNLADLAPNRVIEFLLYDHPSIGKRISCARKFNPGIEKRKYLRLDTVLPVELQISRIDALGAEIISSWQQAFTRDISNGGIALRVNFLKQDITQLDISKIKIFLNINLSLIRKPIFAQAKIAWIKKISEKPGSYILGLDFVAIRNRDRRILFIYARYRKLSPRVIFMSTAIILAVLLAFYIYVFKLRTINRELIDSLNSVNRELFAAKDYSREVNSGTEVLYNYLAIKDQKIMQLNEKINKMDEAQREGELKYQDNFIIEINELRSKLARLNREKIDLEEKVKSATKHQVRALSAIIDVRGEKLLMEEKIIEKMYAWGKARQNPVTGLIASFKGDESVRDWAFTYDQSLAAIAFVLFGDYKQARKIFDFYKQVSLREEIFSNAYYASGGEVSEYTVHAGPNIWLGIAVLQYIDKTGDLTYLSLAEHIAAWIVKLQDEDDGGGIRGGPDVSWYATEHNLDAYAFFDMCYKVTKRPEYAVSRDRILDWLKMHAYHEGGIPIWRGKGDSTIATDTYFWSIAALGPEKLKSINMDPDEIIKFAEDNCLVVVDFDKPGHDKIKITGFDFAKKRHSSRGGVVSSEFTSQVVVAYKIMSAYYKKNNDQDKAQTYELKAGNLLNELEKMLIVDSLKTGQSFPCLPYATQSNADTGHGWSTPKGEQTGSLSGTIYAIFGYYGYNPLAFTPLEITAKASMRQIDE